jgi:hypothetical protein
MSSTPRSGHVVVDGSNIATEGRSMPSLAQLNEAVLAFMSDRPGVTVTVVVDATFGHRIHKSEVAEFDAAVANNELVAPPAGAVGRGDAFVLGIADKAGAMVLSNDSFQEFHGTYEWLFDEGRLVGGKPVPHVGWVFVDRVPVRGPISRRAQREPSKRPGNGGSRSATGVARVGSKEASQPMPVPTAPPPGRSGVGRGAGRGRHGAAVPAVPDVAPTPAVAAKVAKVTATDGGGDRSTGRSGEPVNDVMPFLNFVEHHPVGSSVNATVESYSSHGAYVTIGDVRGYVPLRLMDDPMPRAAKHVMKIGDAVTLVVVSFNPGRRSIDCAVPHMVGGLHLDEVLPATEGPSERTPAKRTGGTKSPAAKKTASKRGAATPADSEATAAVAPAETTPRRRTATQAPAVAAKTSRSQPEQKAPAKRTPAKKAAATKAPAAKAPAKKAAATKAPAAQAPATKAPATKAPATKAAATKAPAAKAPAKKAAATKAPAAKAPAKKAAATKAPAKKAPAATTPAKRAPAKQAASTTSTGQAAATEGAAPTKRAGARRRSAATESGS